MKIKQWEFGTSMAPIRRKRGGELLNLYLKLDRKIDSSFDLAKNLQSGTLGIQSHCDMMMKIEHRVVKNHTIQSWDCDYPQIRFSWILRGIESLPCNPGANDASSYESTGAEW